MAKSTTGRHRADLPVSTPLTGVTETPATPSSAFDPDQGVAVEAEGADAGGFGAADGPGNADSGD